jgi:hypothetical protein
LACSLMHTSIFRPSVVTVRDPDRRIRASQPGHEKSRHRQPALAGGTRKNRRYGRMLWPAASSSRRCRIGQYGTRTSRPMSVEQGEPGTCRSARKAPITQETHITCRQTSFESQPRLNSFAIDRLDSCLVSGGGCRTNNGPSRRQAVSSRSTCRPNRSRARSCTATAAVVRDRGVVDARQTDGRREVRLPRS